MATELSARQLGNAEIGCRLLIVRVHDLCSYVRGEICPSLFREKQGTFSEFFVANTLPAQRQLETTRILGCPDSTMRLVSQHLFSDRMAKQVALVIAGHLPTVKYRENYQYSTAFAGTSEIAFDVASAYGDHRIADWEHETEDERVADCNRFREWIDQYLPPTFLWSLWQRVEQERNLYLRWAADQGATVEYNAPDFESLDDNPSTALNVRPDVLLFGETVLRRDVERWDGPEQEAVAESLSEVQAYFASDQYLLQWLADTFVSVLVLLEIIDKDVAHLQRVSRHYRLEFDDAMRLVGKTSLADDSHFIDVSDETMIETRGGCDDLTAQVRELWREQEKANDAIQRLPDSLHDKLSSLVGKPWRSTVRRECLDWVTIWPGEASTGIGARKVSDCVPTLLNNVAHYDPHETWQGYVELLHQYKKDVFAVRGEIASMAERPELQAAGRLVHGVGQTAKTGDLLRSSLDRCKSRFLAAAEKHRPLSVLIVHLASHDSRPESFWPSGFVTNGKFQLNLGGGPLCHPGTAARCSRSYSLYGEKCAGSAETDYVDASREYNDAAAEAGRLLDDLPQPVRHTIWQAWPNGFVKPEPKDLWINAVFELAWQDHHGSGLKADHRVWHKNHELKLADVPRVRSTESPVIGMFAELIEHVGDPPSYWYSWLNNVWRASIAAIDLLTNLLRELPPEVAARLMQDGVAGVRALVVHPGSGSAGKPKEPADSDGEQKPKRSTTKGEARAKIIAALSEHHGYNDGSCLKLDPIQVNKFAKAIGVSPSTVSTFLKEQFDGYDRYRAACQDAATLANSLKILNGELTPSILFSRIADDHADTND